MLLDESFNAFITLQKQQHSREVTWNNTVVPPKMPCLHCSSVYSMLGIVYKFVVTKAVKAVCFKP